MKFSCPLFAVRSMAAARAFYQDVLGQKAVLDFGANVTFEGGFALQEDFAALVGFPPDRTHWKPYNAELYFESEDLDADAARVRASGAELLHDLREYPWGQRVLRCFDPDGHIIELADSMRSVALRFLDQGLSIEETAARTQHPAELIQLWKDGGQA